MPTPWYELAIPAACDMMAKSCPCGSLKRMTIGPVHSALVQTRIISSAEVILEHFLEQRQNHTTSGETPRPHKDIPLSNHSS